MTSPELAALQNLERLLEVLAVSLQDAPLRHATPARLTALDRIQDAEYQLELAHEAIEVRP